MPTGTQRDRLFEESDGKAIGKGLERLGAGNRPVTVGVGFDHGQCPAASQAFGEKVIGA